MNIKDFEKKITGCASDVPFEHLHKIPLIETEFINFVPVRSFGSIIGVQDTFRMSIDGAIFKESRQYSIRETKKEHLSIILEMMLEVIHQAKRANQYDKFNLIKEIQRGIKRNT